MEQLANMGSEVERALNWKGKGNIEYTTLAFERALLIHIGISRFDY